MDILKNNIDFNMYKVFYAVAEYESFSKTAMELCVSQPAISYTIRRLEEDLNTKLFTRLNRGIALTEDGKKLKNYAENALSSIIAGTRALNESEDTLDGEIIIGIHSHIATVLLPKYISKFTNMYPNVKISIYNSTTNEMKEMFKNRQINILILHYPIFTDTNSYIETKILSLDSCFFGIKKFYDSYLLAQKGVNICEYPLLLPLKGFATSNSLDKVFKNHNMILKSNIYLYSTEMIVSLARAGLGVGWALRKSITKELEEGIFYEIPIQLELPRMEVSLAYDKKYINKTALKFCEYLINELTNC